MRRAFNRKIIFVIGLAIFLGLLIFISRLGIEKTAKYQLLIGLALLYLPGLIAYLVNRNKN